QEPELPAALRTCVSCATLSKIREPRLVVAAGLDAAEVDVVTVRADDVLSLAQRLVGDHVDRDPDRADRAAACAERLADLLRLCGTERLAELRQKLHLVESVVTANEREHDPPVRNHGHRLRGCARAA